MEEFEKIKGITVVYGNENSGKTALVNRLVNLETKTNKILLITSKPEVDFFDCPDKVIISSVQNFDELRNIVSLTKGVVSSIIIDTITDISKREGSNTKQLAHLISDLKKDKLNVLLIVDTYLNFKDQSQVVPHQAVFRYFSDSYLELKRNAGIYKAIKYFPIKEEINFNVIPPLKKIVIT